MLNIFLVCAMLACGAMAQRPEIVLYNKRGADVPTFVATTNEGSDNQLCLPVSIKTTRICVNSGIWLLYPDTNFLADSGNSSIYYSTGNQVCADLPPALDRQVGSYRPAGDPAGANCSLNLYVNKYYAATERLESESATDMPFAFNSAIRGGPDNCNWEFFMRQDFSGFSECFAPDENFVPDFTARLGVQPGDIKSIRKGCSKNASKLNPNHVFNGYN